MIKRIVPLLAAAFAAFAQPVIAPTDSPVGPRRGQDSGGYNIVNSAETGFRQASISGNEARYRSDVNFGNGIRLLGSNLAVNSKDGHGRLFDQLLIDTRGLGNDPYQFASFRIEKNRWYRYDLVWRATDYLNPGLTGGLLGGHRFDTRRQIQDHDFTLFPQTSIKIIGGYSRNGQSGPGILSGQFFDSRGDEYPLLANIDRRQSEYRLGIDAKWKAWKLVVLRGWQRYDEASPLTLPIASAGANTADRNTLSAAFRRTEPYSGSNPFWRGNLFTDNRSWYSVNARFSYAGGRRTYLFDELATGTDRLGALRNRQIAVSGGARRPVSSGGLTLSLFPSSKLTLSNHTAFHQIQMDGDSFYREAENQTQSDTLLRFQYLGIRTFANMTDASYRASKWLGLFGGHRFSTRRIRSVEGTQFAPDFTDVERGEQTNRLHAVTGGVRLQPAKVLSVVLDTEIGRQDRPFTPIAARDYHILGGRVQYKTRNAQVTAASRANYNFNSSSIFTHSAKSRVQSIDASWTASKALSLDGGYSHAHFDSVTGLAYFASGRRVTGDQSVYISNIHTVTGSARLSAGRVDFFAGLSRVQDTGDGRSAATQTGQRPGSSLAAFAAAQTYPLGYTSPFARISVSVHPKARLNFGYQYYDFAEEFAVSQNYTAHTVFASVLWSF